VDVLFHAFPLFSLSSFLLLFLLVALIQNAGVRVRAGIKRSGRRPFLLRPFFFFFFSFFYGFLFNRSARPSIFVQKHAEGISPLSLLPLFFFFSPFSPLKLIANSRKNKERKCGRKKPSLPPPFSPSFSLFFFFSFPPPFRSETLNEYRGNASSLLSFPLLFPLSPPPPSSSSTAAR